MYVREFDRRRRSTHRQCAAGAIVLLTLLDRSEEDSGQTSSLMMSDDGKCRLDFLPALCGKRIVRGLREDPYHTACGIALVL